MSIRITPEEFVIRALKIAQTEKGIARIHTVWDGLNAALREYYGADCNIIKLTDELVDKGILKKWPIKGGVMIALIGNNNGTNPDPQKRATLLAKIKQFES